jgi:hypothetical protein
VLTLARAELPSCETPVSLAVRFVGAWGAATPLENSPHVRRLTQIWLWDVDGAARALLLRDLAQSGTRRDFTFVVQLHGSRGAESVWSLHEADKGKEKAGRAITFSVAGARARLTGPPDLAGPGGEVLLEAREIVGHPKIAMTPTHDRERFLSYFDNVLFNLNVPWQVP